jgi:hypothetical protein
MLKTTLWKILRERLVFKPYRMLTRVRLELQYRIDVCRVTRGARIELL